MIPLPNRSIRWFLAPARLLATVTLVGTACTDEATGPSGSPVPTEDAGVGGESGQAGGGVGGESGQAGIGVGGEAGQAAQAGAGGAVGGEGGDGGSAVGCPPGTVDVRANGTLCVQQDDLYFAGDYEGTSLEGEGIVGWEGLTEHPLVSGYYFNNVGGTEYAFQELRPDPSGTGRTVLYAQILDDDPNVGGTTRAQASLRFADTTDLAVYHTSHRMRLASDFGELTEYPDGIYWFVLFEVWADRNDSWDGDVAGSARWDLTIHKEPGVGKPLMWALHGEYMQPQALQFQRFIPQQLNSSVPIPLDTWFALDVRLVRGEGAAGRLTVSLTVDGEQTQTLFDVAGTTIYPGHPELILRSWQAYKLYFSDELLDWMRGRGKALYGHYNDFAWYKD